MKTSNSISSILVAASSAGVALFSLVGLIPADLGFAVLSSVGLLALALYDYSRNHRTLKVNAIVLRPALPAESNNPIAPCIRHAA